MTDPSQTYKSALSWLYGLQRFGIKLGLENIQRLLAELGLVTDGVGSARLPKHVIHVAGTNGKGSVCAMVDAICRAQGFHTGLFTSPHLVTFRERVQVNGQLISESEVGAGLEKIRGIIEKWEPHPTFFEVATALGLDHFAEQNVDVAILETGLGGRLDATNAVPSNVSVITPIDLDHEKWLGVSIDKIAAEKAGIIKQHTSVISSDQNPTAEKVIRDRARECDAPLEFVREAYDRSPVALRGTHQKHNAAVAIAAVRAAGLRITDAAIARGLLSVQWPARFQRWDERTIIDGAHNPAAARTLASTWREAFGDERATIILAVLADKDIRGIFTALAPIAGSVIVAPVRSERAASPQLIAQTISSIDPAHPISITPSLMQAFTIARAKPSPILVTGSLHFAGDALALLQGRPAAFEECSQ